MKFQITYKETGQVAKFRANNWTDFESAVWDILIDVSHNCSESDYEFLVDGQIVNLDLAQKAATFARNAWEAKRAITKKPIRISQGATCLSNTYRTIWVCKTKVEKA